MPSATFNHTAETSRPIDEVWARLQVAETWANIGPVESVWDPVHDGDRLRSYKWKTTVGPTTYNGSAKVTAAEEPTRMELALDAGEVTGSLVTVLSSNGDRVTQIDVTMKVVSRGMLSTLFFPVVSEAVGNGLPAQVERFAESMGEG